ncbi:unnamed protein product [Prorocentrum cordatum]|uniref:Uncharacterized protein n=1 Tax=Prorocentrum cordatum TaxID=2364126 RepID=A0ABN9Q553_9DINO|nr:unnamed protein product [Polarella glacialis]
MAIVVHNYLAVSLRLPMAYKKFGLVGSAGPVLQAGKEALGKLAGPQGAQGAVTNLGIDSVGGRHRLRLAANATREKRFPKFKAKGNRLVRLKITAGHRNRMFQTNLKPTATYGADVHASSPTHIAELRGAAGRDARVTFKGAQLDLAWSWSSYAEPIDVAVKSIARCAQEWWMPSAVRPDEHVHADVINIWRLSERWSAAKEYVETTAGRNWLFRSKEPISDTLLWAQVAKWTDVKPGMFLDCSKNEIDLTELAPLSVGRLFSRQLNDNLVQERVSKVCVKSSSDTQDLESRGLWWDVPRKLLTSKAGDWSHLDKVRFRQFYCWPFPLELPFFPAGDTTFLTEVANMEWLTLVGTGCGNAQTARSA